MFSVIFSLCNIKDSGGFTAYQNYHGYEPRSYYPSYHQPYTHYQPTTVSSKGQHSKQFTHSTIPLPGKTVDSTDPLSSNAKVQGMHQMSAIIGYGTENTHSMQSSHNPYNQHINYYDSYYYQPPALLLHNQARSV